MCICVCGHALTCLWAHRKKRGWKEDHSCSNSAFCLLCLLVNAHALGFVNDNYSFPSSQSSFSRKVHIQGMQKTSTLFWDSPHPWSIGVNIILFVFSRSLPDIPHLLPTCIELMPSNLSPYKIFKVICLARRTRNCFQLRLVLRVAFLFLILGLLWLFLSHSTSHLEAVLLHSCFLVWEDFVGAATLVKCGTQKFRKGKKSQLLKQWHRQCSWKYHRRQ